MQLRLKDQTLRMQTSLQFVKVMRRKKEIKELVEVLHSKEIQDFINKEYKGAVLPVSE